MIIPLTERIKVIRPEGRSIFPYSNSILVEDDTVTVIDAGAGGNAYAEIRPERVNSLLLSHIHFDHIHGASLFSNAGITVAPEEAEAYRDIRVYQEMLGFYLWDRLMGRPRDDTLTRVIAAHDDVKMPELSHFNVTGYFRDNMVINTGHVEFTALHTPGHSPGHYVFYFERDGILFSGDLDLAARGPWYGGASCDIGLLEHSVRRIMEIKPEILVTSHRKIFYRQRDDIDAMFREYLNVALRREERIMSYLAESRNLDELASLEFASQGMPSNQFEEFWSKIMIQKHLDNLLKKKSISEIEDGCWLRI